MRLVILLYSIREWMILVLGPAVSAMRAPNERGGLLVYSCLEYQSLNCAFEVGDEEVVWVRSGLGYVELS